MSGRSLRASLLGAAIGVVVACSSGSVFHCQGDTDCMGTSAGGVCETDVGYCSFPDSTCLGTQRRYGRYAGGGLGGACVPPPDAGGSTGGSAGTGAGSDGGVGSGPGSGATSGNGATTGGAAETGGGATTGGPTSAAWWDCAFTRRRELTIEVDATIVDATQSDVPVLIVLDETRIDYATAAPDGADLRFVDADDQTMLSAELEHWDPAGLSFAWVRIPAIGAGTTTLYMYWGNPAASAPPSGASAWNDGYAAVWHLSGDGLDATVNANDLTLGQSSEVEGQVFEGMQFSGYSGSPAVASSSPSLTGVFAGGGTLSAWIRAGSWGSGGGASGGGVLIGNASNEYGQGGWLLGINGNHEAPHFVRGFSSGHLSAYGTDGSLDLDRWVHLAVVYDESTPDNVPVLYLDGAVVSAGMAESLGGGTADPDDGQSVDIGGPSGWSGPGGGFGSRYDGIIDEVRISSVPRAPAWIRLQYLSTTDSLVHYGAPHTSPCIAP